MTGVSIVITNRNQALGLPASVLSALHALQSARALGQDGEVVVVDDQSCDGSLQGSRPVVASDLHPEKGADTPRSVD